MASAGDKKSPVPKPPTEKDAAAAEDKKSGGPEFTAEEDAELKTRPIGGLYSFTEEQLSLRVAIGKKMTAWFCAVDSTMSADVRKVYEDFPMWAFYVTKSSDLPKRSYGVCFGEDKKPRLHTAACHIMFTNLTIGGTPVEDLVKVDRWSAEQLARIEFNNDPAIFLDPLGFMIVLRQVAK